MLSLLFLACTAIEGDDPAECTDGLDNDNNGLIDCDDPGCKGGEACDGSVDVPEDTDPPEDSDPPPVDEDGDGSPVDEDCDDTDPDRSPEFAETWDDGIDNDCDGTADRSDASCSADLTVVSSAGSKTLDFCGEWSVEPSVELQAGSLPTLTGMGLTMQTSDGGTCWLTLEQLDLCGQGFYAVGDGHNGSSQVIVVDCDGLDAGDFQGTGYLWLDEVDTGHETDGEITSPMAFELGFSIHLEGNGSSLSGDVQLAATQLAVELAASCGVSDGDEDDDGQDAVIFGGQDCDDGDPDTFLGAAPNDDELACMRDADGDAWGDLLATGDIEGGSDCFDDDSGAFPGAASEEPSLCTRDADSDGWGDATVESPGHAGTDCDDGRDDVYVGAASDEPTLCTVDADTDGYGDMGAEAPLEVGTDCNDSDASEYPGAVDEASASECMTDGDGDGFGSSYATGFYDLGTDCQDGHDDIFPGAAANEPTLCARDTDGDGWATCNTGGGYDAGTDCDDGDSTIFPGWVTGDAGLCVQDLDGDGYGDITAPTTTSCWDDGTDCDDGDDTAHPGAASAETSLCTIDADADGYGDDTLTSPLDAGTDCDDTDADSWPGQTGLDVADGADLDCDGSDNENDSADFAEWGWEFDTATSGGTDDTYAGTWLEVGDWDNDGADDLYVGATRYYGGDVGWILTGPISSWDTDAYNAQTSHNEDLFGVGMGDIDGDGNTDLAARGWMSTGDYGAVWLGPVTGTLTASTADFVLDAGGDYDCFWKFGSKGDEDVQIGDVDGDGQDDLIVGSPMWNDVCDGGSGVWNGAVHVTFGPISADAAMDDSDLILTGNSYPETFGRHPRVVDDMDGDGIDDLVTGTSRGGYAHIMTDVPNLSSGLMRDEAEIEIELSSGARTTGDGAGDWDGDGYGDAVLTSAGSGGGTAALINGAATLSDTSTTTFSTTGGSTTVGSGVAGGGDFDGDGFDDIAFQTGDDAYLFYGGVSGSLDLETDADVVVTWSSNELYYGYFGRPIVFGDFDDDGLDDLAIGTPNASTSSVYHGGMIVVYGQ
ncbi:MAG: hypothetical protein GY913_03720 [Proteobacteria bacterium]|nr:hypothetical protein [Pseudomonadota bacterium]